MLCVIFFSTALPTWVWATFQWLSDISSYFSSLFFQSLLVSIFFFFHHISIASNSILQSKDDEKKTKQRETQIKAKRKPSKMVVFGLQEAISVYTSDQKKKYRFTNQRRELFVTNKQSSRPLSIKHNSNFIASTSAFIFRLDFFTIRKEKQSASEWTMKRTKIALQRLHYLFFAKLQRKHNLLRGKSEQMPSECCSRHKKNQERNNARFIEKKKILWKKLFFIPQGKFQDIFIRFVFFLLLF